MEETLHYKIKRNEVKDKSDVFAIRQVITKINKSHFDNKVIKKELQRLRKEEYYVKYGEIRALNGKLVAFLWQLKNYWKIYFGKSYQMHLKMIIAK